MRSRRGTEGTTRFCSLVGRRRRPRPLAPTNNGGEGRNHGVDGALRPRHPHHTATGSTHAINLTHAQGLSLLGHADLGSLAPESSPARPKGIPITGPYSRYGSPSPPTPTSSSIHAP